MDRHDEDTYIIPHNYTDNGKIFGLIEKQSVYAAALWFIPVTFFNFKFLPTVLDFRIYVEIIIVIPPTLIILAGVGGDTLPDFIQYVYKFYKRAKLYQEKVSIDEYKEDSTNIRRQANV